MTHSPLKVLFSPRYPRIVAHPMLPDDELDALASRVGGTAFQVGALRGIFLPENVDDQRIDDGCGPNAA